jgi:ribonuclease HI
LDYIDKHYPSEAWSHVYTDGSATDATKNGGARVRLQNIESEESLALPIGIFSTDYRTEKEALTAAANAVSQNTHRTHRQLVIFTDALSVLQDLQSSSSKS